MKLNNNNEKIYTFPKDVIGESVSFAQTNIEILQTRNEQKKACDFVAHPINKKYYIAWNCRWALNVQLRPVANKSVQNSIWSATGGRYATAIFVSRLTTFNQYQRHHMTKVTFCNRIESQNAAHTLKRAVLPSSLLSSIRKLMNKCWQSQSWISSSRTCPLDHMVSDLFELIWLR